MKSLIMMMITMRVKTMGRNIEEGTMVGSMRKWMADDVFLRSVKYLKRRGRPPGSKNKPKERVDDPPRTPFDALRVLLQLERKEWSDLCGASVGTVRAIELGEIIANPALAKKMQEEARKLGVAVTMDELYAHVMPWGWTPDGSEPPDEDEAANEQ
jgi:hypothetical protein